MKKSYQKHYQENNLKNTGNFETNIIKNNSEYTLSENSYNNNLTEQEIKTDIVFKKSEYQDTGISNTVVKDFDFKEDNADTNKKHSQTYRNLEFNQEEIKEVNSSNSFDKIEKRENFIDENFIDFKNSDENKSFSDETKNSSLIVTENAHSLKYEKTANKKFKEKILLSKTKLNTSAKSNLRFSESKSSSEDNKKSQRKQKQPKTKKEQNISTESDLKFKDNKESLNFNNEVQTIQNKVPQQKNSNISKKINLRFSNDEKPLDKGNEIKTEVKQSVKQENIKTLDKSNPKFSDNKKSLKSINAIKTDFKEPTK